MTPAATVLVDSKTASARFALPLVLGNTYAIEFSGLSDDEAAASPEVVVIGRNPEEVAARSGGDAAGNLAMTSKPCVEAFETPPPPAAMRPSKLPPLPPFPNPPVHGQNHPHGVAQMHFYVLAGGATIAQGDLVLLWAPFEYDEADEPITLKGDKGDTGAKGDQGDKGDPGRDGIVATAPRCVGFQVDGDSTSPTYGHLKAFFDDTRDFWHDGDEEKPHFILGTGTGTGGNGYEAGHLFMLVYQPDPDDPPHSVDLGSVRGPQGAQGVQGATGATGAQGPQGVAGPQGEKGDDGEKGEKGDDGEDGMTAEEIAALVASLQPPMDNAPTAGSGNAVTSGGIYSTNEAIIARINSAVAALAEEFNGKISAVMRYKGTVATVADLPDSGNTVGDVYNVSATGDNYAWTGTEWDRLSSVVDLSGYLPKQDVIDPANATATGKAADALAVKTALASKASVADATLNGRGFGEWTISPSIDNPVSAECLEAFQQMYPEVTDGTLTISDLCICIGGQAATGTQELSPDGASLMYNGLGWADLEQYLGISSGDVVATRSALSGYVLGNQTEKPLPKLSDVPAVVAPSTSASDAGKAADAKATGDALAGKLSTSGGTVNGSVTVSTNEQGDGHGFWLSNPDAGTAFRFILSEGRVLLVGTISDQTFALTFPFGTTDDVALEGDLPTAETWTFTVDDGQGGTTTVTKSVAVYAAAQGGTP